MTRPDGVVFALNPDLVQRVDATPSTVVRLVDGTEYAIAESVPRFVELVREHRAAIIALARQMEDDPELEPPTADDIYDDRPVDNVVHLQRRKR
ncbi:flagellar FlbD family protein [Luedemannella helvata]|uniref:flagellar FlbD family protein n=1 Tax=Luedemannella helvata TaxID=349315 RepID=UPI0031E2928C